MAIEIMSVHIKMVMFHGYVSLPEGNGFVSIMLSDVERDF